MSERGLWWTRFGALTLVALAWLILVRPSLGLPYFWDEADVYVPGSLWLAEHGLDLRPGVFPDDWSRGHPQGLYLLAGLAFKLLGSSPVVGRSVVLPFAAVALSGTFLLGERLESWRTGLAAALLLGTAPLFLSIGGMLLPEGPLVGLAVLGFLALAHGRVGWAAVAGIAAVWTKETGIFAAAAVGLAVLWDVLRSGSWRDRAAWVRLGLVALPLPALLAFFAWQKLGAGYFVFPHHQGLLWDRPFGAADLLTVFPSLLVVHGRWVVVGVGALVAQRVMISPEPRPGPGWSPSSQAMVAGLLALVPFNAAFFAKMFWLERYALPAHPAVLLLAAWALFSRLRHLAWAPVGATMLWGLLSLKAPTQPNEEELTFAWVDVVHTHQRAFEALPEGAAPVLTSWPMTAELSLPYIGFVDEPVPTVHIDYLEPSHPVGAALIPVRSRHSQPLREAAEERGLHRLDTVQVGGAPAIEVWVR